jgi:Flp pilus assembly protein TadG
LIDSGPNHAPSAERSAQRGQVLALCAVFLVVLMGMAAAAIDVGSWYLARRQVQSAADSAALAGASQLAVSWSSAASTAAANYATNGKSGDSVTYQNTTTLASNDTVKVTASRTAPGFFSKVFGVNTMKLTATASATIKSYSKIISTGQVMPWAVMKDSWQLGSQYSLYTDNSSPNNGAVSLPIKNSAGTCNTTTGASDYNAAIVGPPTGNAVCDVYVNEVLDVKSGQNTGPTKQGIDSRITTWDPISSIVQFTSGGNAVILKPDSKQLVILPVVSDMSGGTTWPGGGGQVKVIGFAFFVLTAPGYSNGGKTVLGTFVGLQLTNMGWETGAFDPHTNTAFTIELTN